jgi:hypothetical protein
MSTWNYMFDNDMLQRMDLERLRMRAESASRQMRITRRAHDERIEALESEVGELALLCRALMGMLKEQGHFDAAAFNAALDKIDLEDGVRDGRVTPVSERPVPRPPPPPPVQAPIPRRNR